MTAEPLVLVVGGGIAGAAAAFHAARAGRSVQMLLGGAGASRLGSGAVDADWPPHYGHDLGRGSSGSFGKIGAIDPNRLARLAPFLQALNLYEVGPVANCVATLAGRLRAAAGCDRAILDLASLPGGRVLLPRVDRPSWDADALCRGYQEHAFAADRGLRFEPFDPPMLKLAHERSLSDPDFAALLDEPDRIEWLTGVLRDHLAAADVSAVLTGPWLGTTPSTVTVLRKRLAKPIGETLSAPGGAAGVRFEWARDRLLASLDIEPIEGALSSLTREAKWIGRTHSGRALEADAVVLATGGLLAGGIELRSLDAVADLATHATVVPGFVSGSGLPGVIGRYGAPVEPTSSSFGLVGETIDPSTPLGREAWYRTGLMCDAEGHLLDADRRVIAGLFAAGDVVADRPRCLVEVIESGLAAGAAAATLRD